MPLCANLGFPRIGLQRELKKALEGYWQGRWSREELLCTGQALRAAHWRLQQQIGIDQVPSNDFSFYDHVLDTAILFGVIPRRFVREGGATDLETYFQMARGGAGRAALEMTKWFDTNYHYLVPEFEAGQEPSLHPDKVLGEFLEAKELGILTRPVLLGPMSFLKVGRYKGKTGLEAWLEKLLPLYGELLEVLCHHGVEWVQLDEPVLVLDLSNAEMDLFVQAYSRLLSLPRPKVCLTSYFGEISDKLDRLKELSLDALHLDLVQGPAQLSAAIAKLPRHILVSLGVVNGRNIWKTPLRETLEQIRPAVERWGADRLILSPSCSLLHCPMDLESETELEASLRERMAFAVQKLQEIVLLRSALAFGLSSVEEDAAAYEAVFARQKSSGLIHHASVQARMQHLEESMFVRRCSYAERRELQRRRFRLPLLPTTTIGSFPQTEEIRKTRAAYKKGTLSKTDYEEAMKGEIERVIRFQERIGLDVLVHGEPERSDMVEYFGAMLAGFAQTQNGWVQSYGSRCVKPPIIYGDVYRKGPMTVSWIRYAQSLTSKPVKGMLTGPITLLQWSFVREDQPRWQTAWQIALAIRDEVQDLEAAGIKIIQIDEPGLREGLPLRKGERPAYFHWAVKAFRLASCGVEDDTQIHTHMCYADFHDILEAITALDADVISVEASRSGASLLDVFAQSHYPNEIGPGVYDVHSPHVPSVDELVELLGRMLQVFCAEQLWVNPDCGLKTRSWKEVEPALGHMVEAAAAVRCQIRSSHS